MLVGCVRIAIPPITISSAGGTASQGTENAIAPGLIETDMTRATAERIGVPYETYVAKAAEQIPVARTGTPEDIAAAASFFARQEASFISGQVLYVAGGPKA